MVGHENVHLLPSNVIPAVHIGCGVESCGSGIDRCRALCVLCEIELLSPHRRSLLYLCKDLTGRISCCRHWFLASPLRLHFLLDVSLTCSMYLFVLVLGVCAHPSQVESVHVQILRLLFVPFEGPARLCMSTCCMRRAGWPPALITSTLSAHFLSLCSHTEKPLLMSD